MKLLFNCSIKPCIINRRPYIIQYAILRKVTIVLLACSYTVLNFTTFILKYNGLGTVFAGDRRQVSREALLAQPQRWEVRGVLQKAGGRARRTLQGRSHSCKMRNSPQKDRHVFENKFSTEIKEISDAGEENRV